MIKEGSLIHLRWCNEFKQSLEKDIDRMTEEFYQFLVEEEKAERFYDFYGRFYSYDNIEKLSTKEMTLLPDRMRYVWGGPGPDFDDYKFVDYGKTWSFNEEDLRGNNAGT